MSAALRPYVTAGVALVGASAISVTPIAPPPMTSEPARVSSQQVTLTAATSIACTPESAAPLCETFSAPSTGTETMAVMSSGSSLLYVPINVVTALLSVPAWEIQAMNRFADAMIATGSWLVWGPTNVFGFDEQDPPKLRGLVDMALPFKPFSSVVGDYLSWWAQANLPMNSGCAALPGACPDRAALLDSMFQVPLSELYAGYTFPTSGEGVTNPFTGKTVPWAGDPVQLEPFGPFKASWEWLTAPPHAVETVKFSDYFTVPAKLGKSLFNAFYPFVQNSEWFNDEQTAFAPFFRAIAPLLCPSCDQDNPYDNPWLYDNYPRYPHDETQLVDQGAAISEDPAQQEPPAGDANQPDLLSSAVAKLAPSTDSAPVSVLDTGEAPANEVKETSPPSPPAELEASTMPPVEEVVEESTSEEAEDTAIGEAEDTDASRNSDGAGKHRLFGNDRSGSQSVQSLREKLRSTFSGGRHRSPTDVSNSSGAGAEDSDGSDSAD